MGVTRVRSKIRESAGNRAFGITNFIITSIMGLICLYPIIYTFSASISDPTAAMRGDVWLYPVGFSAGAYKRVLEMPTIWLYYYNTIWYTIIGTFGNVIFTVLLAYPLSKPHFVLRTPITFITVFTMFFGGGLIPTFLLVNQLGLYGTRWVMVFVSLISTFNVIIARTFFQTLPNELFENARIEGASELRILRTIVLPLSMPIIAVLVLYYGVGHWNSYFNALIYLPHAGLQPIQVLLRRVVLEASDEFLTAHDVSPTTDTFSNQIKYAVIFFAMAPIMCLYPFLQKYFVKGVMIGALKG